jgi:hypothetical protein
MKASISASLSRSAVPGAALRKGLKHAARPAHVLKGLIAYDLYFDVDVADMVQAKHPALDVGIGIVDPGAGQLTENSTGHPEGGADGRAVLDAECRLCAVGEAAQLQQVSRWHCLAGRAVSEEAAAEFL